MSVRTPPTATLAAVRVARALVGQLGLFGEEHEPLYMEWQAHVARRLVETQWSAVEAAPSSHALG
jgi:hypothetical protein